MTCRTHRGEEKGRHVKNSSGGGSGGARRGGWVGGQHGGRHVQWEAHTVGGRHVLGRQQVGEWRGWVGGHTMGLGLHPAAGAGQCGT